MAVLPVFDEHAGVHLEASTLRKALLYKKGLPDCIGFKVVLSKAFRILHQQPRFESELLM